ncbi:unnamed protein product [Oppiella nova]|nr:unnamed protein product [Oppiella nova]CAG2169115.1 unnamed protein product [Oppiella nova]
MFTNGFKETADREVVVEDTSAEAFKVMLRYMYCERLVLPEGQDFQLIHHVLKLADYYQLFRLIDSCERHLIATIGLENVEIIARLANDYRMSDLISVVKAFLDTNFNHFLSSRDQSSLNSLNTSTDNLFFEIMTKNFRKTKLFFEPMTKTRTYCAGAKNSYGYQESSHYYYTPDAGQYSTFSFDKLHES